MRLIELHATLTSTPEGDAAIAAAVKAARAKGYQSVLTLQQVKPSHPFG